MCNDAQGNEVHMNLTQWQALGLDAGTTVQPAPTLQQLIDWGREMLQQGEMEEGPSVMRGDGDVSTTLLQ